jgi:hypothetical protein
VIRPPARPRLNAPAGGLRNPSAQAGSEIPALSIKPVKRARN